MRDDDTWHPLGLSNSIEAGSSAGTRLLDKELVVWRDVKGLAHVWEDRCPHRGMKLSFGFVRGDHIACLYHGWQYDGAGQCRYIPAHPDLAVPSTIRVPIYAVQERSGMIWTTLAETPPEPSFDSEATVPLRSLYLDGSVDAVTAGLGSVAPMPFISQGKADTAIDRINDQLSVVSVGHDRLLIGIQAISPKRTALHLAITGSSDVYAGRGQRHFAEWAMQLRRAFEAPRKTATSHPAMAAAI